MNTTVGVPASLPDKPINPSSSPPAQASFEATYFKWADWRALWQVRRRQLAEDGVMVDLADLPEQPVVDDDAVYEWDFYHMEQVYLSGAGGF